MVAMTTLRNDWKILNPSLSSSPLNRWNNRLHSALSADMWQIPHLSREIMRRCVQSLCRIAERAAPLHTASSNAGCHVAHTDTPDFHPYWHDLQHTHTDTDTDKRSLACPEHECECKQGLSFFHLRCYLRSHVNSTHQHRHSSTLSCTSCRTRHRRGLQAQCKTIYHNECNIWI